MSDPQQRPKPSPVRALLAFAAGLGVCTLVMAPVLLPVQTYEAWCGVRYGGAIPSPEGLLLTLRPAPAGLRGPGSGPWVELELRNVSDAPLQLLQPERVGGELAFFAQGAEAAIQPGDVTEATWVHSVELQPGERVGFTCDLSRWLKPTRPGPLEVRAERATLGLQEGGVPCRSNSLQVEWPPSD